eukprot:scaffold223235_cov32-Tisochrysis_lutea.AAC.1
MGGKRCASPAREAERGGNPREGRRLFGREGAGPAGVGGESERGENMGISENRRNVEWSTPTLRSRNRGGRARLRRTRR